MKLNKGQKWLIIRQYIIGWIVALIFYSIIRGEGTQELGSVQFEMSKAILVSFIGGIIFGTLSGMVQILTEEKGFKRVSIQKLMILRIIYVLLFLISMVGLAYLIFGKGMGFLDFAFEPGSLAIYLYIVVVDGFMFALRQITLYFGGNNLWKLFTGKYYTPREEERIFMFLDLRSSTAHAERLGHIDYSRMIQDCFTDLAVVIENEAEIYQYVGDEVVLTWPKDKGLNDDNCLQAFYNYRNMLNERTDHYRDTYNCQPYFKAGLNVGVVTVTEVGKYKKEIAYHGDTINIAARIQGKCNDLNRDLLVSEELKNLMTTKHFKFDQLGHVDLKGKSEKVKLYGVEKIEEQFSLST